MSDNYAQATQDALMRAARYIRDAVSRRSPGAKSAESWRLRKTGDDIALSSSDMGGFMSETGRRHPVFPYGPRNKWDWTDQNRNHPERTGAIARAVADAAGAAERQFADEWLQRISAESPYFEYQP